MRTVFAFLLLAVVGTSHPDRPARVHPYTPPAQGTTAPAAAQSGTVQTTAGDSSGHAMIVEEAAHHRAHEGMPPRSSRSPGFRVPDLPSATAPGRRSAAFLVHHPELPAYLSYLAPNFRVRVGDLRNKRRPCAALT